MRTIKKVEINPVFVEECIPEDLEEGKIYISECFNVSQHKCFCGCGEIVILPFNDGINWRMDKTIKGVSFEPSIGNYTLKCKSHYIIRNNVANFI